MVLQQEKPLVVWGWAEPNETVTVTLATGSQQAQANERGEWKAVLPAMKAGGPYTLTVSGSTKVAVRGRDGRRGVAVLGAVEHGDGHRRGAGCAKRRLPPPITRASGC